MNYKKLTAILCAGAFITLSGCGAAKGDEITIEQEAAPKADSAEVIEKQEVTEEEQEIVTVSAKDQLNGWGSARGVRNGTPLLRRR